MSKTDPDAPAFPNVYDSGVRGMSNREYELIAYRAAALSAALAF